MYSSYALVDHDRRAEGWWLNDNLIDSGHEAFLNKFLKILPH